MARPVRFTRSNLKPESEFKRACLKWLRFRFGKHFWTLAIAGGRRDHEGDEGMWVVSEPNMTL